jgi:hypothetical protein
MNLPVMKSSNLCKIPANQHDEPLPLINIHLYIIQFTLKLIEFYAIHINKYLFIKEADA